MARAGSGVGAHPAARIASGSVSGARRPCTERAPPPRSLPAEVHRPPARLGRGVQRRAHLIAPGSVADRVEDLRLLPQCVGRRPCAEPSGLFIGRIPSHPHRAAMTPAALVHSPSKRPRVLEGPAILPTPAAGRPGLSARRGFSSPLADARIERVAEAPMILEDKVHGLRSRPRADHPAVITLLGLVRRGDQSGPGPLCRSPTRSLPLRPTRGHGIGEAAEGGG
jgi:hypothetical protein